MRRARGYYRYRGFTPLNLFDFGDGHLKFSIKIPANVTFEIGIIDTWGNQNYVVFPAHQTTHGLVRDGEWGQAAIPVVDIRGLYMDLRMLTYAFVILERNGTACEFAVDDIYWDAGVVSGVDGSITPRRVNLMTNVPNPFNAATDICFEMPTAGEHSSSGIYYYKLTTPDGTATRKMALVK